MAVEKDQQRDLETLLREHWKAILDRWFSHGVVDGKKFRADGYEFDIGYYRWTHEPSGDKGTGLLHLRRHQRQLKLAQAVKACEADLVDLKVLEATSDPKAKKDLKKSIGTPAILPVPDDAVKLDWSVLMQDELAWRRLGMDCRPASFYTYEDAKGRLLGYVVRFDPPKGPRKEVRRLLWCGSEHGWRFTDFPQPYPLYGLKDLADRPGAPVLVVEGEKTADAARKLFKDHVVVSWPNGGEAVPYTQWGWLKGRDVVVWPDADDAGQDAATKILVQLTKARVRRSAVVELPPDLPASWDLADPMPEGLDAKQLVEDARQIPSEIQALNEKHAVVIEGNSVAVYMEDEDPSFDHVTLRRLSFQDLRNLYLNQQIVVGSSRGNPITKDLGSYWLEHPDRRQYRGIYFYPERSKPGYYNLWRGWALKPAKGDWGLLKQHIFDNLCQGREDYFDYLMDWAALMVQRPAETGRVAVVMRGKRGTGKGVFAQALGKIFGSHFAHVSNARHLTGHFNSHLRSAVFVFVDEAFWAGDKQGESTLKTLVTETKVAIEQKGKDVVQMRNCMHFLIASNMDWVVPAGPEERRYFVLDVADTQLQQHDYFRKINQQLEDGGYEGLFYDLLQHDISAFDVYEVPKTEALLEQKIRSMSAEQAWWYDILQQGKLPGDVDGTGECPSQLLLDSLVEQVGRSSYSSRGLAVRLKFELNKWLDGTQWAGAPKRRKFFRKVGYDQYGKPKLTEEWGKVYMFPTLKACREAFERILRQPLQWEAGVDSWSRENWGVSDTSDQPIDQDIPF